MNPIDLQEDEQIEIFVNMIHSMHKSVQLEGLVGLRKLLSNEDPANNRKFSSDPINPFAKSPNPTGCRFWYSSQTPRDNDLGR